MTINKDLEDITYKINREIETFENIHKIKLNITVYNGDKSTLDGKEWEGDKVLLEIGEKLSNIIKWRKMKPCKKHNWEELDSGWDFDNKFNFIVEECSKCGAIRENDEEGNWDYR